MRQDAFYREDRLDPCEATFHDPLDEEKYVHYY